MDDTKRFVAYLLRNTRKGQDEIETLCELFDIEGSIFESAYYPCPEADTLDCLERAFPYLLERPFRLGSYKLDGYFPSLRIGVECDEHNHEGYDTQDETKRECFIRDQLQCWIVRYNPFAPKFSVLDVIRKILGIMVSPGYQEIRVRQFKSSLLPDLTEEEKESTEESEKP